ncbi:hypothetical protein M406DRAFT_102200 [Cryphonectria parasitica EP155]|uniref:Uncharacterized protein n=1 Tax=Cryphonectria parasitica (strain ATCC 38755 / EP155) TaxID=660469 RepID=A0A9P5CR88_CRYP1|nr:uncharacterized protein M406DRAFT_102200 [Cryphonectria parasitica EP155]KAF3768003.1 hypothetical protein M406DRAFT_102200 [Cryphonectria parasitica EP155]
MCVMCLNDRFFFPFFFFLVAYLVIYSCTERQNDSLGWVPGLWSLFLLLFLSWTVPTLPPALLCSAVLFCSLESLLCLARFGNGYNGMDNGYGWDETGVKLAFSKMGTETPRLGEH